VAILSLANLLVGSYTIISVQRSVFLPQPASDDTKDNRVVMTPVKHNDGELGEQVHGSAGRAG
jgi:hypothetical protein